MVQITKKKYHLGISALSCGIILCMWQWEDVSGVVQVRGSGASFPYGIYKSWIASYKAHREKYVSLNMTYAITGSGKGKEKIKARDEVEYAATDTPLSEEETLEYPDLLMFPTMAGSVVLGYNLPWLENRLLLTRDQIVGIYNGTYKFWNEETFIETNSKSTMPQEKITVIARADTSGTTFIFTGALAAFSTEWNKTSGIFSSGINETDNTEKWPMHVVTYFGNKSVGVAGLLTSFKYSIAYLSVADAEINDINYAIVQNKMGYFINPNTESVESAMDYNAVDKLFLNHNAMSLSDSGSNTSYPIVGYTYLLVYQWWTDNCDSIKEFLRYINWSITNKYRRQDCVNAGMVPLSGFIVQKVHDTILKSVTCKENIVWESVLRDIELENQTEYEWFLPLAITVPLSFVFMCALLVYTVKQKINAKHQLDKNDWNINIDEITFYMEGKCNQSGCSRFSGMSSIRSLTSINQVPHGPELIKEILQWPGKWRMHQVGIRLLHVEALQIVTTEMKRAMLWLRDVLVHVNVARFHGLTEVDTDRYVISEYCSRGTISEILQDAKYNLTNDFKFSAAYDVAAGLQFLHSQNIIHGHLKSRCCLIDNRWTVKISDWEYFKLCQAAGLSKHPCVLLKNTCNNPDIYADIYNSFWVAPEVLRAKYDILPTSAGDIYSLAIILYEIFTRVEPYSEYNDIGIPSEIIIGIINNNLRPESTADIPMLIRQIMEIAWSDAPMHRPKIGQVMKMLHHANPKMRSVLDSMMGAMEEYTCFLEGVIEERDVEFNILKQYNDNLLSTILPAPFSSRLAEGLPVNVQVYESLGIISLETVNFSSLLESYTPCDTVAILNGICGTIDLICRKYAGYSISMQNGIFTLIIGLDQSSEKITGTIYTTVCHMCIDVILCSVELVIGNLQFLPEFKIGAHCGQVVAGIISTNIPQFVVFGKAFEIARSIRKLSESGKVLISDDLYRNLEKDETLIVTPVTALKTTKAAYWLSRRVPDKSTDFTLSDNKVELLSESNDTLEHPSSSMLQETNRKHLKEFGTQTVRNTCVDTADILSKRSKGKKRICTSKKTHKLRNHGTFLHPHDSRIHPHP